MTALMRDLRLDAVYARLPKLACRRKCQQSCGPIMMSRGEWNRVTEAFGDKPMPTPEQAATLTCPMLNVQTGGCSVYHVRPMICRLWGLVKAMACPWGCVPERWLSDSEAHALMDEVERMDLLVPVGTNRARFVPTFSVRDDGGKNG